MSRRKDFKELEKLLDKKIEKINTTEIVLKDNDFNDGRLTKSGYISLKNQASYISVTDEIELFIPRKYEVKFNNSLSYFAAVELFKIKNDLRRVRIVSILLLLIGVLLLISPNVFEIFQTNIFNDVIIIISWVFIWTAVEKTFFDRHDLKKNKIKILHIMSAKVITY